MYKKLLRSVAAIALSTAAAVGGISLAQTSWGGAPADSGWGAGATTGESDSGWGKVVADSGWGPAPKPVMGGKSSDA